VQPLLGQVEVAEQPDQAGQGARALVAVEGLEVEVHGAARQSTPGGAVAFRSGPRHSGGGVGMMGRTSIDPVRTAGIPAASLMASSRFLASTM